MANDVPKLRVFISWAGSHAETLGIAFHTFLPDALNTVQPFMSGVNIDKGTRWGEVLSGSLQDSSCAIVCLTPESITSVWVAFETGAISRAAGGPDGARSRIWTYLFGLEKKDLQLTPFAEYQATSANEEETFQLVRSINQLCPDSVSAETLKRRFDNIFWPNFSKALLEVPAGQSAPAESKAPAESDVLAEILRTVRSLQREIQRPSGTYTHQAARAALAGEPSPAQLSWMHAVRDMIVQHFPGRPLNFTPTIGGLYIDVDGKKIFLTPAILKGIQTGTIPVSSSLDPDSWMSHLNPNAKTT